MSGLTDEIEQQLSTLLRRTSAIHSGTDEGGQGELVWASYGILALILDEGPQRLGHIAAVYGLDPSTITRQVHTVVRAGLATKAPDPVDRRASLLSLTDKGRAAITSARRSRRDSLRRILREWTRDELDDLLASLTHFNTTVGDWLDPSQ